MRFECRCQYRADSLLKMKLCSREASRLEFLNVNWLARVCFIFLASKAENLAIYQYVYMAPMFAVMNWMSLHVCHASQETLSSILSLFSWGTPVLEPKRPRFINRLVIMPFWVHLSVSWLEAFRFISVDNACRRLWLSSPNCFVISSITFCRGFLYSFRH